MLHGNWTLFLEMFLICLLHLMYALLKTQTHIYNSFFGLTHLTSEQFLSTHPWPFSSTLFKDTYVVPSAYLLLYATLCTIQ